MKPRQYSPVRWISLLLAGLLFLYLMLMSSLVLAEGRQESRIACRRNENGLHLIGSYQGTEVSVEKLLEDPVFESSMQIMILREGTPLDKTACVKTGDFISLGDREDSTAVLVLKGDLLKTGSVSIAQLIRLAKGVRDAGSLQILEELAGDIDDSERIDIVDLVLLARYLHNLHPQVPAEQDPANDTTPGENEDPNAHPGDGTGENDTRDPAAVSTDDPDGDKMNEPNPNPAEDPGGDKTQEPDPTSTEDPDDGKTQEPDPIPTEEPDGGETEKPDPTPTKEPDGGETEKPDPTPTPPGSNKTWWDTQKPQDLIDVICEDINSDRSTPLKYSPELAGIADRRMKEPEGKKDQLVYGNAAISEDIDALREAGFDHKDVGDTVFSCRIYEYMIGDEDSYKVWLEPLNSTIKQKISSMAESQRDMLKQTATVIGIGISPIEDTWTVITAENGEEKYKEVYIEILFA